MFRKHIYWVVTDMCCHREAGTPHSFLAHQAQVGHSHMTVSSLAKQDTNSFSTFSHLPFCDVLLKFSGFTRYSPVQSFVLH